jgi:hypothetical protein
MPERRLVAKFGGPISTTVASSERSWVDSTCVALKCGSLFQRAHTGAKSNASKKEPAKNLEKKAPLMLLRRLTARLTARQTRRVTRSIERAP